MGAESGMNRLTKTLADREERHDRLDVRDKCLKKAIQLVTGLDSEPDLQSYNRSINTISALSQLAIAISLRD